MDPFSRRFPEVEKGFIRNEWVNARMTNVFLKRKIKSTAPINFGYDSFSPFESIQSVPLAYLMKDQAEISNQN